MTRRARRGRRRIGGITAVTVVAVACALAAAPLAAAGDAPTAHDVTAKIEVDTLVSIDLARQVTGDDVRITDVTYLTTPLVPLATLSVGTGGSTLDVQAPAWPDAATQTAGMAWQLTYTVTDNAGRTASGRVTLRVPGVPQCSDTIGTLPIGTVDAIGGGSLSIDFTNICKFDTSTVAAPLVAGSDPSIDVAPTTSAGATTKQDPNAPYAWTYTPAVGAPSGADLVPFTLTDSVGRTVTGQVLVLVNGTAPVVDHVVRGGATGSRDNGVLVTDVRDGLDWLASAVSAGARASTSITDPPAHGTAQVLADGSVRYTADADWTGEDSYGYSVFYDGVVVRAGTVLMTVVDRPSGPRTLSVAVRSGAEAIVDVASAMAGDDVRLDAVTPAAHGSAAVTASGRLSYVSSTGFTGPDSVVTAVTDAYGQAVEVTVNFAVSANLTSSNVAVRGAQGKPISVAVGSLFRGDYSTVSVAPPGTGQAVVSGDAIGYTPSKDFAGTEVVSVTATDRYGYAVTATVTVTIVPKPVGRQIWVSTIPDTSVEVAVR